MQNAAKGYIKITEKKITTKPFKDESGYVETWVNSSILSSKQFIVHNGNKYQLYSSVEKVR
jgi:hypothetical protein